MAASSINRLRSVMNDFTLYGAQQKPEEKEDEDVLTRLNNAKRNNVASTGGNASAADEQDVLARLNRAKRDNVASTVPQPSTDRTAPNRDEARITQSHGERFERQETEVALKKQTSGSAIKLPDGMSEIARTKQTPAQAAVSAADLESRLGQYSATMNDTERNMGTLLPGLDYAKSAVANAQTEWDKYERKLTLLDERLNDKSLSAKEHNDIVNEYNALLPYAQQAAKRLDNEISTYNSLSGQARQMQAQYNSALLQYQQALPEYEALSSRGKIDAEAMTREADKLVAEVKKLDRLANDRDELRVNRGMTPEEVGAWQQETFNLRTEIQEKTARARELYNQSDAAQKRYGQYQYNQLLGSVEKYQSDPDWKKLSATNKDMMGGEAKYEKGVVNYGKQDIDYAIINGDADTLNVWNGNNPIAVSKSYLTQMTDRERAAYNYLYAKKGKDAADAFLEELTPELNARQRGENQKKWGAYAEEDPWGTSAFSVLVSPAKAVSFFGQALDLIADGKIDQNAAYNQYSQIPSDIRGTVSKIAEEKWGKEGSFGYQTAMSMADFLFNSLITGEFFGAGSDLSGLASMFRPSLLIMGTGAAADTVIDLRDKGLDSTRAFVLGAAAGLAEMITEKYSLETMLSPELWADGLVKYWLKNMAAEGSEEVASTVLNWTADFLYDLVSGQNENEWQRDIRANIKNGMSARDATMAVVQDRIEGVVQDALGGALSGGVMAGVGGGYHSLMNTNVAQAAQSAVAATRQDLREANAPMEAAPAPMESAPVEAPIQEATPRTALEVAVDKLAAGEQLTQNDAKRILNDPASVQALQDAGVMTGAIRNDSEGRQLVRQLVEQYAATEANTPPVPENLAQETQEEQQGDTTTPEESPHLRLKTAEETLTPPVPQRKLTLGNNTRTEATENGRQTETPAPARAEDSFIERARRAAESDRSRAILDRSERRTGVGRFLSEYRKARAKQRTEHRYAEQEQRANQLQYQANARNLAYTSAKEYGVANGTDRESFRIMPTDMLDRGQLAAKQAAAKDGVTLDFMIGQGYATEEDGSVTPFRGWVSADGKRILVRADHSRLTWQEILGHEDTHKRIKSDPGYREALQEALLADDRLKPYLSGIIDKYVDAYTSVGVTDETEILDDFLSDYRSGFDMLDVRDAKAGDVRTKNIARKDIRAVDNTRGNQASTVSGPVASKLKGDKARRVTLSRWVKINRIVPNAEVARSIAKLLDGEISIPENTVTPSLRSELEKLGVPVSKAKGNFSREMDSDYLAAVESGDMDTAQKMVDEAAKRAGFHVKGWHQTARDFTVFNTDNPNAAKNDSETPNGIFFKTNNHDIGLEGKKQMALAINPGRTLDFKDRKEANAWYRKHVEGYDALSKKMEAAIKPIDDEMQGIEDRMFADGITDDEYQRLDEEWNRLLDKMHADEDKYRGQLRELLNQYFLGEEKPYDSIHLGYDGHRYVDGKRENVETYIVFSNKQAKSADPVTYDDNGNIIPLSERFNPEDDDIRFSRELDPAETARAELALQPVSPGEYTGRTYAGRSRGRSPKKKVSRVRTHAFELGGLYNEVEAQMAENQPSEFTYDPVSEQKSMREALGRLKKDFAGEAEKLSTADQWGGSDLDTAMGILYQYRQIGRETGDYSQFNEWSHIIQQKGTKGGQFVQAFAKYSRTATGVAQKAAESLRDQHALTPAQQKRVEGHVNELMRAVDDFAEEAARGSVEDARGAKKGLKLPSTKKQYGDTQKAKDAMNVVKEIYDIFSRKTRRDHGAPVEDWTKLTGDQLASRIAGRFNSTSNKQRTTMQTILDDLLTYASEHALPKREGKTPRTATERITDYLNNREAYGTAWSEAKQVLREMYANDPEKLDALEAFLNSTISYNGDDLDKTMFRAILESADALGLTKQDILKLTAAGVNEGTIDQITEEFLRQTGSDDANLRDTVARHITNLANADNQEGRLTRMEQGAAKELDIKLQNLLRESRQTKSDAANRIAQYLINDLGISGTDAAIAANHIASHYMERIESKAVQTLEKMFEEKGEKVKPKQRDKLMDLIHLGGLTNTNVEDAVVDALGIGTLSRAQQRQIMDAMAQFADTLDAIADDDLEGLRELIRLQAAQRGTRLSPLAEKVLNGETDAQYLRDFAMAQLDSIAADYAQRSTGEMISTFQTISHLLNMRTALRNVTANQVFDLIDSAANNVSMLPDMIYSLITGKRTVGLNKSWLSQAKRQGAVKGAGRNLLEVNLDVAVDDRQKSKYGTAGRRTWSMANSGTVGKILSSLEEVMGYELNTTDEFHKGSVMAETLESLARFVDRGDMTLEEAQEFAKQTALYRSFQDDSYIGAMLGAIKDALNIVGEGTQNGKKLKGKNVHDFGLGDFMTKYTQVPGALIHRAIEYTPAGYVKMLGSWVSLAKAKHRGENTNTAQRRAALDFGRATTGSGLITLFAVLARAGLLRKDDKEDKNAKAVHQAQGFGGTQLNFTALERWIGGGDPSTQDGDVLVDLNFLEPLDSLMGLAALIASPEGLDLTDIKGKTINAVWDSISSLSMMQTLRDCYQVYQYYDENDPEQKPLIEQLLWELASSSITGFIPSPVRQLAQATDTTYRDQYRSKDISDQIRAKAMNSIPGLRQMLAPKITPLGEDRKYQAPVLNYLNASLNPGNISVYQANDVVDELDRVYSATNDAKIWPERNAPYSITQGDNSYTLTPDERTQYQRTRGQTTSAMMEDVIGEGWYKKLDATQQAEVLNWIGNFANYAAKVEFMQSRGEEYSSNTYNKYYQALTSGTDPADVVAERFAKTIKTEEPTPVESKLTLPATAEPAPTSTPTPTPTLTPTPTPTPAPKLSDSGQRLYDQFVAGGVSKDTADAVARALEGSSATGHAQWREVYDAAGKEGEKAVTSVMTDEMKRNWRYAKDVGVSMDDYIKVREGFKDLNGNGSKSQNEWNATLDEFTFSSDAQKDKQIKGTLWQILTGSTSTKNNPYDKAAGQAVIDGKASGGGSGTGKTYAPAKLRLPTTAERRAPIQQNKLRLK